MTPHKQPVWVGLAERLSVGRWRYSMKWLLSLLSLCVVVAGHASEGERHRAPHHRIRIPPPTEGPEFTAGFEANIYRRALYGNLLLDYRPESTWLISGYVTNMPVVGSGAQNFAYDAYVGLAKTFRLSGALQIVVGTQNGTTLVDRPRQWHGLGYAQASAEVGAITWSAGPYIATPELTTTSQAMGAILGVDVDFQPEVLWAEVDWFTGNNNLSGGVVNLFWRSQGWLTAYLGVQAPATNSGNAFAGNLGFILDVGQF